MSMTSKNEGAAPAAKPEEKKVEKREKVEHKNIYEALSAFQGEMKAIEKDGHVNFKTKAGDVVDFRYTTYGKTVEVINPLLGAHGLSFRHRLSENGIECILMHETSLGDEPIITGLMENGDAKQTRYGGFAHNVIESGLLPLDLKKSEMKDVGAQITYGKRYTLAMVLGLATEDDKDIELLDKRREKTEGFAFKKSQEMIKKSKGEELEKQIEFIKEEIEKIEKGEVPSIGLSLEQYNELLVLAEKQKAGSVDDKK